ncbi:MAG: hypothetical protein K0R67_1144 [Paenibacillus sp.]|nr:hypothetical protein [Paenibacillus sp.]
MLSHNGIYSDAAIYAYTILPVTIPTGGGVPFIPVPSTPPVHKDDGVITPDEEELLKLIDTAAGQVVPIDSNVNPDIKQWTLQLSGSLIQKAAAKQKALEIRAAGVQLLLPPDFLVVKDGEEQVQLQTAVHQNVLAARTRALPAAELVSSIFDFSLLVGENRVSIFNNPISVTFDFDDKKVKNTNRLAVYYYDESLKQWQYVGGTVQSNHTVTAELSHFSMYAVMESTKTFTDIAAHWAKEEIESMAGRHIIDGVTDQLFQPEQMVTRAQFVTLLTRALQLPAAASGPSNKFKDVPNDAWYSSSVYAAYEANLVSGVDESAFAPEEPITREQMAVLIVKAYLYRHNLKLSDLITTQEVKYEDEGAVSVWARASVRLASGLSLMSGDQEKRFNAENHTSRAQAAVVLFRLLTK